MYPLNMSMEQMANVNNRYVGTAEEVKPFLALIEEKNITAILDGKQRNSTIYQDLREDVIKRIRQALECVQFFAPTTNTNFFFANFLKICFTF